MTRFARGCPSCIWFLNSWSGGLSNGAGLEGRGRVLDRQAEQPGQVRTLRVHETHQTTTVDVHLHRVAALVDADRVPAGWRKGGIRASGEEALVTRITRIFLAELPAVRLQDDVIKVLVVGVVPEDPADLPRVRVRAPELVIRADPNLGCEVAPSGRGNH